MKISQIDQLKVADQFFYKGTPATVFWKREKDNRLTVGYETEDKSVCLAFRLHSPLHITLTSRLDSKMVTNGGLYELDLADYQPL